MALSAVISCLAFTQSLLRHLTGRAWPSTDQPLVAACFKLLSAVSFKTLTATFIQPDTHRHCSGSADSAQQWTSVQQPGSSGGSRNSRSSGCYSSSGADAGVQGTINTAAELSPTGGDPSASDRRADRLPQQGNYRSTAKPSHCIGSTADLVTVKFKPNGTAAEGHTGWGGKGVGWLQGWRQRRQQARRGRSITAQQMLELPLYKELQQVMQQQKGQQCGSSTSTRVRGVCGNAALCAVGT